LRRWLPGKAAGRLRRWFVRWDALLSGRGRVARLVVPVVPSPGKPWPAAPRGRPVGYPVRQFLGRLPVATVAEVAILKAAAKDTVGLRSLTSKDPLL